MKSEKRTELKVSERVRKSLTTPFWSLYGIISAACKKSVRDEGKFSGTRIRAVIGTGIYSTLKRGQGPKKADYNHDLVNVNNKSLLRCFYIFNFGW